MAEGRIQTRISEALETWLAARARRFRTRSVDQQARIELELWNAALTAELRRIRLTLPQARCIAAVLGEPVLDDRMAIGPGVVYAQCYDAFRLARTGPGGAGPGGPLSSYAQQFGIDEQALLTYLAALGPVADHALRGAIARWWENDDQEDSVAGFAEAGLRVTDDQPAGEKAE